jgi:hypothetical protein
LCWAEILQWLVVVVLGVVQGKVESVEAVVLVENHVDVMSCWCLVVVWLVYRVQWVVIGRESVVVVVVLVVELGMVLSLPCLSVCGLVLSTCRCCLWTCFLV